MWRSALESRCATLQCFSIKHVGKVILVISLVINLAIYTWGIIHLKTVFACFISTLTQHKAASSLHRLLWGSDPSVLPSKRSRLRSWPTEWTSRWAGGVGVRGWSVWGRGLLFSTSVPSSCQSPGCTETVSFDGKRKEKEPVCFALMWRFIFNQMNAEWVSCADRERERHQNVQSWSCEIHHQLWC